MLTSFTGLFSLAKGNGATENQENLPQPSERCSNSTPVEGQKCSVDGPSLTTKRSSKPNFSFSQLTRDVLLEHGPLTTKELYKKLAEKHPQHFSMDDKNWKASVRNCLSRKSDFVRHEVKKNTSRWSLSEEVISKLKSSGYCETSAFKENYPSTGKYVPIAPKPLFRSSLSQDSFVAPSVVDFNERSNDSVLYTPLQQRGFSADNRECVSEDKNLFRKRSMTEKGVKTSLKRRATSRGKHAVAPKKSLFSEQDRLPSERTCGPFREQLDSRDGYRVQIQGPEAIPLHVDSFLNENFLLGFENAVFDEFPLKSDDLKRTSLDELSRSTTTSYDLADDCTEELSLGNHVSESRLEGRGSYLDEKSETKCHVTSFIALKSSDSESYSLDDSLVVEGSNLNDECQEEPTGKQNDEGTAEVFAELKRSQFFISPEHESEQPGFDFLYM